MQHEMNEANFESRESKQSRAFYGLTAWNAVHLIIGVAAAGVAVSTSHWLDTTYKEGMQGLLGINHAGLWSVCFAEIPENETAKNLTDHLSNIVDENLFGSGSMTQSKDFMIELEEQMLENSPEFETRLAALLAEPADSGNVTSSAEESLGDSAETPDMIPASLKDSEAYKEAVRQATVDYIVNVTVEGFPLSSGCSNPMHVYKSDVAGWFFRNVPYPYGYDTYHLFQCLRAFVVGFGIFGLLSIMFFLFNLCTEIGSCSSANLSFAMIFATLQVVSGLAGVVDYFILLARIASSNATEVINVSYLFVDYTTDGYRGIANYWGWSGWVFLGSVAWSLLMFPFLCCTCTSHIRARDSQDTASYGLLEAPRSMDNKDPEHVSTPAGDE